MPRTPHTIVAPLPNEPRVMSLAKTTGLTRREAFAAAAEAWAWMLAHATDDIVMNTAPDSLDAVVDVDGFGDAMFHAGLVGTVDGGLVLPVELRSRKPDQRGGRKAAAAEDQDDRKEHKRKQARIRQRRRRAGKALTKAAPNTASLPLPADDGRSKQMPRRLGDVDGFPVMLLFRRSDGCPFYKLAGAEPKEWTGTVTDAENPSYGDALASLHAAMKREGSKGLGSSDAFRPSLQSVLAAAERYRDARESSAAAAARRDEGNRALAEASMEDQDDIDHEPAERDCHAPVTHVTRDTVTVTLLSRPESVTCPPNSLGERGLGNVTCHASVTESAPSSSSFSVSSGNEEKENTTTTSTVTPRERDHEGDILERLAPRVDPQQAKQQEWHRLWLERIAEALGTTADAVEYQRRNDPDFLLTRCKAAGIDPRTGLPVTAEASHTPADAREDRVTTSEPTAGDKPATGSLEAREHDEPDHGTLSKVERLRLSCDTLRAAGDITGEVSLKTVGGITLSFADADDDATMQENCRTSYAG